MNVLTELSKQGSYAARVSEVLLQSLCTSRKELKERYAVRKEQDRAHRANASEAGVMGYHRRNRTGEDAALSAGSNSRTTSNGIRSPAVVPSNAPGTANVVGSVSSQLPATSARDQYAAVVSTAIPPIPLTSRRILPPGFSDNVALNGPDVHDVAFMAQSTPSSHAHDLPMFGIGPWAQSTPSAESIFSSYYPGSSFPRQEQDVQQQQVAGRPEGQGHSQQPQSFMEGYMMSPSEWAEFALGSDVKT